MNTTQPCLSSGPNVGPVGVLGLKARYKSWLVWYIGGLTLDMTPLTLWPIIVKNPSEIPRANPHRKLDTSSIYA